MFGFQGYQEVMVISIFLALFSVLLSKFLANQEVLKKAKEEIELYRKKSTEAQKEGDMKKANKYMSEMMKASQKQMRENMKPMMFSFIMFILAFSWLGANYSDLLVSLPFTVPFLGKEINWFWWYLIIIIPMSMFFRKILDVQ
ncbi:MAG: hypothetical protein DRP18_00640 [Candidatus Aenigmatarchaeota archaeon]|nr:MAG: hypothetical protein DRP18_00640 [Candidatus Aenigmarchaeota archaeon]RLJ07581.1 MAG: hypothetical protein DRP16_03195 [Candidatus Aenigmarchaeota archaeon]